jgi:hypothetical protein
MALASVLKRKRFAEKQMPVVADIIKLYKSVGYKVVDGNETIIIIEPDSTFRIFISRVSHCVQFYYLAEPDSAEEHYAKNLESAEELIKLEKQYKQKFG